MVFKKYRNLVV